MNLEKNCEYEDDEAINKATLSFIALKEADAFRRRFVESGKCRPKHSNYLHESITVDLDYMDADNTEYVSKDRELSDETYKYSWDIKWDRMSDLLDEKFDESFDLSLLHYTDILRLHIEHRIKLSNKYCGVLFCCDTPSIVKQVFDANLIEPIIKDQNGNVSLLMNRFYTDEFLENMTMNSNLHGKLLYSYAIIFYRLPIFHIKEQILKWVSLLGEYVNVSNVSTKNKKLNPMPAYKAIVDSLIANGLFTQTTLDVFLKSTRIKEVLEDDSEINNTDESSNMSISDLSNLSDDEIENIAYRRNNRRNSVSTCSLQNRISFRNEGLFPCSLKDLCRIKIKQSMQNYTKKTVYRLTILPKALKEFVLFNDRIDPILKIISDFDNE